MKTQLLITLFFCHFLADYTHLSTAWMLNAKRLGRPLFPIYVHASIHGVFMGIAAFFFFGTLHSFLWICGAQTISHFLIDVWKGRMNGWFPSFQNPKNKWHWVVFGADQFLHAVVIILMVHFV